MITRTVQNGRLIDSVYIISYTYFERNKIFILLRSCGPNKTGHCVARLKRCAVPSPLSRLRDRARSQQNNGSYCVCRGASTSLDMNLPQAGALVKPFSGPACCAAVVRLH